MSTGPLPDGRAVRRFGLPLFLSKRRYVRIIQEFAFFLAFFVRVIYNKSVCKRLQKGKEGKFNHAIRLHY